MLAFSLRSHSPDGAATDGAATDCGNNIKFQLTKNPLFRSSEVNEKVI